MKCIARWRFEKDSIARQLDTLNGKVASQSKGVCPLLIRPSALAAYWPLIGNDSPEPDRCDLSLSNSPTKADHPRIISRRSTPVITIKLDLDDDYVAEIGSEAAEHGETTEEFLSRLLTKWGRSRVDERRATRSKRNDALLLQELKRATPEQQAAAAELLGLELKPNGEIVRPAAEDVETPEPSPVTERETSRT